MAYRHWRCWCSATPSSCPASWTAATTTTPSWPGASSSSSPSCCSCQCQPQTPSTAVVAAPTASPSPFSSPELSPSPLSAAAPSAVSSSSLPFGWAWLSLLYPAAVQAGRRVLQRALDGPASAAVHRGALQSPAHCAHLPPVVHHRGLPPGRHVPAGAVLPVHPPGADLQRRQRRRRVGGHAEGARTSGRWTAKAQLLLMHSRPGCATCDWWEDRGAQGTRATWETTTGCWTQRPGRPRRKRGEGGRQAGGAGRAEGGAPLAAGARVLPVRRVSQRDVLQGLLQLTAVARGAGVEGGGGAVAEPRLPPRQPARHPPRAPPHHGEADRGTTASRPSSCRPTSAWRCTAAARTPA